MNNNKILTTLFGALALAACGTSGEPDGDASIHASQAQTVLIQSSKGDAVSVIIDRIESDRAFTFAQVQVGAQHFELDIRRDLGGKLQIAVYDPDGNVVRAIDERGVSGDPSLPKSVRDAALHLTEEAFIQKVLAREPSNNANDESDPNTGARLSAEVRPGRPAVGR